MVINLLLRATFRTSASLFSTPMRKKRRIDPAVMKVRVERKIAKCTREIEKIEKAPRYLIPILEYEYPVKEGRELQQRPPRVVDNMEELKKSVTAARRLWAIYRKRQATIEQLVMRRVIQAQTEALDVLKKLNLDLYNATISKETLNLVPYHHKHMKKETPPSKDYKTPDGYIKDVSQKWVR